MYIILFIIFLVIVVLFLLIVNYSVKPPFIKGRQEQNPSSSLAMNSYIVFYKKGVPVEEMLRIEKSVQDTGGQITALYKTFGGFAAQLRPEHVSALQKDPAIQSIEHDGEVRTG
jgi:hypothetical protein